MSSSIGDFEFTRVWTNFPQLPTQQPRCVEQLHEFQRQQWIDFSNRTLQILNKKNKYNTVQIILIVVMIILILVIIGIFIYFVFFRRTT